ncbi:MAG: HEAT repeat domain-containing protein [Chitinispirillales bacterium]|jgi:HEAT repeat protein|nr:HEAT repeat domain-containing protein [Chitinispirillales bacterium]
MIRTALTAAVCIIVMAGCSSSKKYVQYEQRLGSPDVSERRATAQELRGAQRDDKLVPSILQACRDEDPDVRMHGFFALGKMNPVVEGVIPAVFEGLRDSVTDVRRAAVSALSEFNPFPNVCLPPLTKLLADPDDAVRKLVQAAFADLQGVGVGSLIRFADDKNADLRLAIITMLGTIGPPAKSALIKLNKISGEDEDEQVREMAQWAAKQIDGSGKGLARPVTVRNKMAKEIQEEVIEEVREETKEESSQVEIPTLLEW